MFDKFNFAVKNIFIFCKIQVRSSVDLLLHRSSSGTFIAFPSRLKKHKGEMIIKISIGGNTAAVLQLPLLVQNLSQLTETPISRVAC